jgi:predicted O-methyltransferase YrrM
MLYRVAALMTTSPDDAAHAILGRRVDYAEEYAAVRKRVSTCLSEAAQRYPDTYAVEDATAYVLYTLVREARPSLTVEVGVADGRSTQIILSALDANDAGRLVSVDIAADVGGAAAGHPRWDLRVHSAGWASTRQLRDLLADVGTPDLFFHDAAHTYALQYADYLAVWAHLAPGGIFISDDVDASWAFRDMATDYGLQPIVLLDRRKATGLFVRPPEARCRRARLAEIRREDGCPSDRSRAQRSAT